MKSEELSVEKLTAEELETLDRLVCSGETVFWAPIEIESDEQLETLGITREQCQTWCIGGCGIRIHLTPTDRKTHDYLLGELWDRIRRTNREKRCRIPGQAKPLIMCPECNNCSACPYPEYRDLYPGTPLSWNELAENGYETPFHDSGYDLVDLLDELRSIRDAISAVNPKYYRAIFLREYYGLSVKEIAEEMRETPDNVYFFIRQAKKIASKFK